MNSGASTSDKSIALAKIYFDKARAKIATMSRPAKVMAISTAIAAALIIGFFSWKSTETTWTTLFNNLDREDAAAIVAKLKESKVPHRIGEDGSTIQVPEEKVRELRLEMASGGLPRGGGVGFESFDKMRLGATEFEQRVLFRRAQEGELSRTIDTIAAVQSTRVHLVLPERSVFVGRTDPASASVVLKLRGGRTLGPAEVAGIVHLVASSVAGLAPERVAIVTTEGTMLHKPRKPGEEGEEDQTTNARSLESNLEERARSMLEKVVGPGHVDVRVSADVDRSRVERTEDHFDPKQVIRSEQKSIERTGNVDPGATGVPGAESNLPTGSAKPAPTGTGETVTRESSTRNFEVDHVTEKRLVLGGTVRRLSVAVVVDGSNRSKEDTERLAALVRSAVGADEKRGDVVTVDSVAFLSTEPAAPVVLPPVFTIPSKFQKYVPVAACGLLGVVVVSTILMMKRRAKKARVKKAALALAESVKPVAMLAEPLTPELLEPVIAPNELRAKAHERAASDPATAALVLRFWLDARDGAPLA